MEIYLEILREVVPPTRSNGTSSLPRGGSCDLGRQRGICSSPGVVGGPVY